MEWNIYIVLQLLIKTVQRENISIMVKTRSYGA